MNRAEIIRSIFMYNACAINLVIRGGRMKKFLAFVFVLIFVLSACSTGPSSTVSTAPGVLPTVPPDFAGKSNPLGSDAALAGAVIFKTNCITCHGDDGKGDGPASQALDPRPANLVALSQKVGDDFLFWRINTGVIGTAMPAWKGVLSDEQIWDLVAFIRTLN